MASQSGSVWAIDIGNCSIKALHLSDESGTVEVIGFDCIEHGKILSGGTAKEAEREELIAISLRQFVRENDLGKNDVIVSVPSQNSFARFVNLPPVEKKRIPEIVKFEAAQQIPFDINDVQWDWQLMSDQDSQQQRVGIFAIKNEVVTSSLEHFERENVPVRYVQMAPMALYNYACFDRAELGKSENRATVILDIGATNTDLVVCTASTVWQRCIPMGGNAFTRAIADTFRLNFDKAEKLKRTAAMSKYARQIFQAMRPVFSDLAAEIQRSLGFYSSSNNNVKLVKIIAFGGGTKMRGLLKYLQQSLQIPVERPDSFKRLAIGSSVSAAKFHDNVSDFGIVYGLALQGLDLGRIESNLLPRSIARSMVWASKARYFTAAAGILLLVSAMAFGRVFLDKAGYSNKSRTRDDISDIISEAEAARKKVRNEQSSGDTYDATIQKEFDLFKYRDLIPFIYQKMLLTLPDSDPHADREQQSLYEAFEKGDTDQVLRIPRKDRKQIFVTSMSIRFTEFLGKATFDDDDFMPKRKSRTKGGDEDEEMFNPRRSLFAEDSGPREGFRGRGAGGPGDPSAVKEPGFVVTMAGYSPYENVGELIEPAGVENDRSKWGIVTRLRHPDDKSSFDLYKKDENDHFKWKVGDVGIGEEMPGGIGVRKVREPDDPAAMEKEYLADPMTGEVISKVPLETERGVGRLSKSKVTYEINDHWFILNLKLLWKDCPVKSDPSAATGAGTRGAKGAGAGRSVGRGRGAGGPRAR